MRQESRTYPMPEFQLDPQLARDLRKDGWQGISNGLAVSLNTLHLHDLAMVMTPMADLGMLGQRWSKSELTAALANHVGYKRVLKVYYMLKNGKVDNRHRPKNPMKNALRDCFLKLSVSFSPKITIANNREKISQKTPRKASKRGRLGEGAPESEVYVPSERQFESILQHIVYDSKVLSVEKKDPKVAKQVADLKRLFGDREFSIWDPIKPFDSTVEKSTWRGFYGAEKLWSRVIDVPGEIIARRAGSSRKTAMTDIKKAIGVHVVQNDLITKLIWSKDRDDPELFANMLPLIEEVKRDKKIPSGAHLRDELRKDGNSAPLGRQGFEFLVKGGANRVYLAIYPMNTYNATNSPYNPIPIELREVTPIGKEDEVKKARCKKQISENPYYTVEKRPLKTIDRVLKRVGIQDLVQEQSLVSAAWMYWEPRDSAPAAD